MKILTIIAYFSVTLLNISAANCLVNPFQQTTLPPEMPVETEMSFSENGGMAPTSKQIKLSGNLLFVEERTFQDRTPRRSYVEITNIEKSTVYKAFVDNKFDLIKNDEKKEIVYDAPSEGISITADRKSFNISAGANSPLSGLNLSRYQAVRSALFKLEAKYKDKPFETNQNIAVIKYDPKKHNFIFQNARPLDIYSVEFAQIDKLVIQAVSDYNSKQKEGNKIKNLSAYKYQFLPVSLENREKIVWVNAFCNDFGQNWRNEIITVDDGGNCFFNLKINLSKQEYFDFQVNGIG